MNRFLMKRWVGRWLMLVALLHSVYALLSYRAALGTIVRHGVVDAVGTDPVKAEAAWFVLCGLVFLLLGLATDHIEKNGVVPRLLGWGLLAFGGVGAALMPDGGFWLFIPPGAVVVMGRSSETERVPRGGR